MGQGSEPRAAQDPRWLYIGNLSWKASEDEVRDLCSRYGEVLSVSMPRDKIGRVKGYATVYYAEEESARWAMRDLHKSDFRNRPLEVKFSVPHKVRVIVY